MNKPKKLPDLIDDYCPVSSSGDCTGLIPSGVKSDDELEAYKEMYNFLPPPPDAKNADSTVKKH